jgi:ABC-type Fe3+ transport system permease subunit/DNA-binding beta-propeller fold protein YncE
MKDEKVNRDSSFILHPSSLTGRPHPNPLPKGEGISAPLISMAVLAIVGLCSLLPLAWLVLQVIANPTTLRELRIDSFRISLLLRTIAYNLSAGLIATILALPSAWVIGRGRGFFSRAHWLALPISLLMPSLVISYGWTQIFRILNPRLEPGSALDIARCVWSLATWLWPAPAMVIGLALRQSDAQVQQQALLDGALLRVMLRQLAGPIIASVCAVSLLAMQEFAVYEPSGISVVATEVRMVFETGAYSSADNPITQQFGLSGSAGLSLPDQPARASAAIATALPLAGVIALLSLVAWRGVRRISAAEQMSVDHIPETLAAPVAATVLAWAVVGLTLVAPLFALVFSLKRPLEPMRVFQEFSPQLFGTVLIASMAGVVALILSFCATLRPGRKILVGSVLSFLVGGQILAIVLIRVYNRNGLGWVYDGPLIVVMAYIARFGWLALAAASVTWSTPWRMLRDLAAIDGAGRFQTARSVIWPIAAPILGASAMFVAILSLTEVPATVLLAPQRPQMLVPMLMTWVHMQRYDAMLEAALLMAALVIALGAVALLLAHVGLRAARWLPILVMMILLSGCGDPTKPDAVWLSTGTGPAQVVYPRGIAYSPTDDSFFIVDREARIQHLDHDGRFLNDWRTPEKKQGKPVGLTVGPDGNLYVPDTHYHRVIVYSPDGKELRQWGRFGNEPGQFIYPTDIAFDARGNVFVSEYGDNDRIQVFDPAGKFLYQFGHFGSGLGEFNRPQSIVIDGDTLYAADACNHRIAVFKIDGTFVRNFGKIGSNLGELRFPYGLDIDSQGRLVVCEFGNNRVQLLDKETGAGLATWGMAGRNPGELAYPWAVAIDRRGRVVTVDAGNNRVQVFEF